MRKFIDIVNEALQFDYANSSPLSEGNRIGSAVTLGEIPGKYKHLPVLGRGATTIALDLDQDHVLLFTRDRMKFEWLRDEGLVEYLDEYTATNHVRGMRELPIMILKAVKLAPLSAENKKIAKKLCDEFSSVRFKSFYKQNKDEMFRAIYRHFGSDEKHILYRLMNFLANYDTKDYAFDLIPRNFMQNQQGELVVLDPIACSELIGLLNNASAQRSQDREQQKFGMAGYRW